MQDEKDFFDKTGEAADKVEARLRETFEKVRASEEYAKFSEAVSHAGEYIGKRLEDLKDRDITEKAEKMRDKAESETEKFIGKARIFGASLADELDEVIDSLKDKLSGKDQNDGKKKT